MKKTLVILSADGLPLRFMNLTNGYASFEKRTEIASCVAVTTVTNVGRPLSEKTPYVGGNGKTHNRFI